MLRFLRFVTFMGAIGFFGAAIFFANITATASLQDPDLDPKFSNIVEGKRLGYSPLERNSFGPGYEQIPQSEIEREYIDASYAFKEELSAIESQNRLNYDFSWTMAGYAIAFSASFVFFMFPWVRFVEGGRETGRALSQQTTKLVVQGTSAVKGLREPSHIVGRSGFMSYSVADELTKWSKLRDDGVVTTEEFDEARASLLSRDPHAR